MGNTRLNPHHFLVRDVTSTCRSGPDHLSGDYSRKTEPLSLQQPTRVTYAMNNGKAQPYILFCCTVVVQWWHQVMATMPVCLVLTRQNAA
jgi:hypothetical protein